MKRRLSNEALPMHDYRAALETAVSWLGERYLLAEPAPRLSEERRPYFAEERRWHPAVVTGALAKARKA